MPDELTTQKTAKGHEIPVPERGEFYRDLERVVQTPEPQKSAGRPRRPRDK